MIVVDTNIIAYLLLEGEHTEKAEAVLLKDSQWKIFNLEAIATEQKGLQTMSFQVLKSNCQNLK